MLLTVKSIVIGALRTILKGLVKGLKDLEKKHKSNESVVEIGQNTEKSLRDMRRLAVSQNPEKKPIC